MTTTNDKDIIELHCIFNYEISDEDLDIAWIKSNEPVLYEVDCNM